MASERMTWDNWGHLLQGASPEPDDQGDTRTGCYCRNDKMDLESYANYIKVCALFKRKLMAGEGSQSAVSGPSYMYGLGFIPVTMVPSYWPDSFVEKMYKAVRDARLPVYSRSPVGLSYYAYNSRKSSGQPEWWISKMDVAERLGTTPDKVTIKEVFQVCGLSLR